MSEPLYRHGGPLPDRILALLAEPKTEEEIKDALRRPNWEPASTGAFLRAMERKGLVELVGDDPPRYKRK